MKVYRLLRIDNAGEIYDCYNEFLIRASSPRRARQIASERHADEGADVWLDKNRSTCQVMSNDGDEGIIMSSFNAG